MGVIAALLSAILASSKDIVSKKLSVSVDGTVSSFASFLFALPFYFAALLAMYLAGYENFVFAPTFLFFVVCRSLTDTFAETCKMHALARGELSVVSSLISLHPIFILFFSPLIAGDPITPMIVLGVAVTVMGNVVLLYHPKAVIRRDAVLLALATAFFFSLNNCFDRLSVQTATPLLSGCVMTLLAGLLLFIPAMRVKGAISSLATHHFPFFIRGFFEVVFMVSKLYALQFLTAAEVSAFIRLSLLFSVIGGKVMFKEMNFVRKFFGAVLTILGVVIVLLNHA